MVNEIVAQIRETDKRLAISFIRNAVAYLSSERNVTENSIHFLIFPVKNLHRSTFYLIPS